jgi:hypothetical protein
MVPDLMSRQLERRHATGDAGRAEALARATFCQRRLQGRVGERRARTSLALVLVLVVVMEVLPLLQTLLLHLEVRVLG